MPDKLLALLQPLGTILQLKKNDFIFHCGDTVEHFYYVIDGELQALRYQNEGREAIMMRATNGEFFAAASMALENYPCAGKAASESRVLKIAARVFNQQMAKSSQLAQAFSMNLAKDLKKQCGRLERLRLSSLEDRVLHFIACETHDGKTLDLTMPVSAWANELGAEPESLYRSLKKLQDKGIIQRDKKQIVVIDS